MSLGQAAFEPTHTTEATRVHGQRPALAAISAGLTLQTEYAVLDITMVASLIGAIWSLLRVRRWSAPQTRRKQLLSWVRAGLELTLPLSAYLQVPVAIQPEI